MIKEIKIKLVIVKNYLLENKKINQKTQNSNKLVSEKIEFKWLSITLASFL